MTILGIIAEYNPFHNGHLYQLTEAKKTVSPDYVVSIMSGNFLQRGEPALFDKYTRAKMALANGIDAVYELPAYYACASAAEFAKAAVLSCRQLSVTHLAFGAECTDLSLLQRIAETTKEEDAEFCTILRQGLAAGESYAKAYGAAVFAKMNGISPEKATPHPLCESGQVSPPDLIEKIMAEPNNILAVCYLRAIQNYAPDITPVLIPRTQADYHDKKLCGNIASASAIRLHLHENAPYRDTPEFQALEKVLPAATTKLFPVCENRLQFLEASDFDTMLRFQIQNLLSKKDIEIYDFPRELENRLYQKVDGFPGFSELTAHLKTKQYTHTRICRALTHLLLSMRQDIFKRSKATGYISYVRLLGFSKDAAPLIKYQRAGCFVPYIQKVSEGYKILNADENSSAALLFSADLHASDIYRLAWHEKYHVLLPSDYEKNSIVYTSL